MNIHVYTSFSYSYLNRARVLAASVRRHHPDWIIWAVITDKEPENFKFDLADEDFDEVLFAEDLYGEETESWLFKHDIVEACTAVKGRALKRLMADKSVDAVVYFDPDIALFNPVNTVLEALETHSIVLTPHQLDPDSDNMAIRDNEITTLDYGTFNLGFFAVRNDGEADRFSDWWTERLDNWCYDRLDIGVFVDQKWCNLVPCFFDSVKILRDPSCNVASWNLSQRIISINDNGTILCNGIPLSFFHFTKLGPVGDVMTQRYARGNVEVYEIWNWYRNEVARLTEPMIPKGWWYYGMFESGRDIPKRAREIYRERDDLRRDFPRPLAPGFEKWLSRAVSTGRRNTLIF